MTLAADLSVDATQTDATFRFTVRNAGNHPAELSFRSAKHADVEVLDGDETVWRWSDGRMFAQALQPLTIEPGQSETYEFQWTDPPSGDYEAVATLNTADEVSAAASFSV